MLFYKQNHCVLGLSSRDFFNLIQSLAIGVRYIYSAFHCRYVFYDSSRQYVIYRIRKKIQQNENVRLIFTLCNFSYIFFVSAQCLQLHQMGGQWSKKGRENQLMQKIAMSQLSAAVHISKFLSNIFEAEEEGKMAITSRHLQTGPLFLQITPQEGFAKYLYLSTNYMFILLQKNRQISLLYSHNIFQKQTCILKEICSDEYT